MTVAAKYPLADVFGLIQAGKYWFSAPSRSIDEVIRVYAATNTPKSNSEAEQFILGGISTLTDQHFYQRTLQWGAVTDIYGLIWDGRPWFVKFAIADEEAADGSTEPWLQEISFHPPHTAFVTVGGISIPAA